MFKIVPIIAEVLDKEPSIATVWEFFGLVGLIGFSVCRFRWWLVALVLPVAVISILVLLEEFSSVNLLPLGESPSYMLQCYAAMTGALVLPAIGAIINLKKRRPVTQPSE
jgi:hypothetical protein